MSTTSTSNAGIRSELSASTRSTPSEPHVAATCGADGVLLVDGEGSQRVPAFEIEVVDTTGCGDAFSAGFMRGLSLGRAPADAARLGSACASLVAQGLGSDAGEFDLETADRFAADTPVRGAQP